MGKMSDAYIASEWAYNPVIYGKKPVYILVSQSGETADIIACKKHLNGPVISITNCKGSSIDKMADYVVPLDCGKENAIAATKSYVAQVTVISLVANATRDYTTAISDVKHLKEAINEVISKQDICEEISKVFVPAKDAFFLGRSVDHFAALEASLKLKETCYIHSEAYPGGELKHGPVALVTDGVIVVGFISDDETNELFRKNLDYIKEQKGTLVIISSNHLAKEDDHFVTPDVAFYLEPVIKVVVMQFVAYFTSKNKGINVDNPRSLVKAVTVE
jgi:glucosamine--fructose-6-phosphate aminotransferase (isomerizing)